MESLLKHQVLSLTLETLIQNIGVGAGFELDF